MLIEYDSAADDAKWLGLATVERRWIAPGLPVAGAAPAGPPVEDG